VAPKSNSQGRPLPAGVADVALVAADTCAAIGDASVSWWHEAVRTDRAPKPVIQQPRFTRWKLEDVRRFWAERAAHATADTAAGERMTARAKKASAAAQAKRAAASSSSGSEEVAA
jgi:hypothetical protein